MHKKTLPFLMFLAAISLSACGLFSGQVDETADWPAAKLYREAKEEMSNKNYEKAIEYLEKLESRYPFGIYAQQAQIDVAYAHYRDNDQAQALAAAERFIKLHPNHPNIDYMYYLRGLINFNDKVGLLNFAFSQDLSERDPKAAQAAFDSFKLLVTRFPDSIYTPDALLRMKYLLKMLAQHELHVAKYYYRRGAYLATVNRAQAVLKQYPDSPAAEEALYIMSRAYDQLGMTDLRDDANRVLHTNFPQSEFLTGDGKTKDKKAWWKFW